MKRQVVDQRSDEVYTLCRMQCNVHSEELFCSLGDMSFACEQSNIVDLSASPMAQLRVSKRPPGLYTACLSCRHRSRDPHVERYRPSFVYPQISMIDNPLTKVLFSQSFSLFNSCLYNGCSTLLRIENLSYSLQKLGNRERLGHHGVKTGQHRSFDLLSAHVRRNCYNRNTSSDLSVLFQSPDLFAAL